MNELRDALIASLGRRRYLFVGFGVAFAVFLILPIIVMVPTSFTSKEYLSFPPVGFSLRWYQEIFADYTWTSALRTSIVYSMAGTALATVSATLAALGFNRLRRGQSALNTLLLAPIVVPFIVYALGLYTTLDRFGAVGSSWGVIIGQSMLAFPLVFITVLAGLRRVDSAYSKSAASLGARWPRVVFGIELRLSAASVAAGALLAAATCFDEVVIALFLSSPSRQTLPVTIWYTARLDLTPDISAMATFVVFLVMATAAAVFIGRKLAARWATEPRRGVRE